jgi:hypothetical protein
LGSSFNVLSQPERQIQLHATHVGVIDDNLFSELAFGLGTFAFQEVAPTGLRPNDLARGCKLESLGHGFLGFAAGNGFWHGAWTIAERHLIGNRKIGKNVSLEN